MPQTRQSIRAPAVRNENVQVKRRASPLKQQLQQNPRKRPAFNDITNAFNNVLIDSTKKKDALPEKRSLAVNGGNNAYKIVGDAATGGKGGKTNALAPAMDSTRCLTKVTTEMTTLPQPNKVVLTRPCVGGYAKSLAQKVTITDVMVPISNSQGSSSSSSQSQELTTQAASSQHSSSSDSNNGSPAIFESPECPVDFMGVEEDEVKNDVIEVQPCYDYDAENKLDPFQLPAYAKDIFDYYRRREAKFSVGDYMGAKKHKDLSRQMRSVLVDWMVEVQENFELNHETLYLAVKLTDIYLDRAIISKEILQLVGATGLFIAAKYDERSPPVLDDFLYICDDAYTKDELLQMERTILKLVDFDIGIPLSYRFLRRYAKATKVSMEILTLARYILETSLMFYDFVSISDSKMAAACFLLALRMKHIADWLPIHEQYCFHVEAELEQLTSKLNTMLHMPPPSKNIKTVLNKYSHEVFFEVAKTPLLPLSEKESAKMKQSPKK